MPKYYVISRDIVRQPPTGDEWGYHQVFGVYVTEEEAVRRANSEREEQKASMERLHSMGMPVPPPPWVRWEVFSEDAVRKMVRTGDIRSSAVSRWLD